MREIPERIGIMRKPLSVLVCLSFCLLLLPCGSSRATGGLATAWQNDYAAVCTLLLDAAEDCSLCHTTVPALNPYGQDILDFGFAWFVLEGADSDDDGRTNGDEIYSDCTLPGDAASPTETASWSLIKTLYSK